MASSSSRKIHKTLSSGTVVSKSGSKNREILGSLQPSCAPNLHSSPAVGRFTMTEERKNSLRPNKRKSYGENPPVSHSELHLISHPDVDHSSMTKTRKPRLQRKSVGSNSRLCLCTTEADEAFLDSEIKAYEEHISANPHAMYGHNYGRTPDGLAVAHVKSEDESPAKKIRTELKTEGIGSTSKMGKEALSDTGTPQRLVSPDGNKFVLAYKALITMRSDNDPTIQRKVEITYYQSEASAARNKKAANVSLEDKEKAKRCPMPTSFFYSIENDEITPERLEEAKSSKRQISFKGFKASAIAANAKFEGAFEHSHLEARRHGQRPATAVVDSPSRKDELISIPARREHNSLRLVTAEVPAIAEVVHSLGKLYFSEKAELLPGEDGKPLPILKSENITWQDENGNKIEFVYKNALQTITPIIQYEKANTRLIKSLFETHFANVALVKSADHDESDADIKMSASDSDPKPPVFRM